MAGKLSNQGGLLGIQAALGVTPSSNRYLALCTSAPTDSALGAEVETPGVHGYSRQTIVFGAPTLVSGAEQCSNTGVVTFGPFAVVESACTHVMVMDDVTAVGAAHMVAWASLDTARTPGAGDEVQFAIGSLSWNVN